MEILRSWGLEQEVCAGGADLRLAAAVSATLADRQQQDFSLGIPQPETLAALSPSVTAISPQDHLEPVLLAHLRSLGGAVRFHTELVGLDQHDGGVSVRVRAVDDGAEERIEARYVVGADGAGSPVRRAAGIEERQLGSEGEHLAVLFHGAVEERIRGHRYGLHIVTTPESGVFVPSGTPGRWVYDREWSAERDAQGVPTVERPPGCDPGGRRHAQSRPRDRRPSSAGPSGPPSPSGCAPGGSSSSATQPTGRPRAGRPA